MEKRDIKSNDAGVLIVYRSMEVGGTERQILNLIKVLSENRYEIDLALFDVKGLLLEKLPNNIKVYDLNKRGILGLLSAIIRLNKLITSKGYKFVLAYGDYPGVIAIVSTKLYMNVNTKLILSIRNLMSEWVNYQKYSYLRRLAIKRLYVFADKYVAVSKEVKKDLVKNFGIDKRRIEVIYNTIDTKEFVFQNKKFIFSKQKKPRLLYIGRLVKQKRVDLLIKSFNYLVKKYDARLRIVGNGPDRDFLIDLTEKLKLTNKVEFKPATIFPGREIRNADLFVLPSTIEGFPNTILECMASGTPVLTSPYPGYKEMICDGEWGYVFKVRAGPHKLSKTILDIFNDKNKMRMVALKARNHIQFFSFDAFLEKYKQLLN